MDSESIKFVIDWELEKKEFQEQIREMIKMCVDGHKVISLPITIIPGLDFASELSLMLSQLQCQEKHCSHCCECSNDGKPICVMPAEFEYLANKYGKDKFITDGTGYALPYPCPFLKAEGCNIYQDRPLVCCLFPFQPGGTAGEDGELNVMALASDCSESRRIARAVYMMTWRLRRQFKRAKAIQ